MRKPFPVHRSSTITRENIRKLLADNSKRDTPRTYSPEMIADEFCGIIGATRFAEPRHIQRVNSLLVMI